jgi:hypothetical protein
MRLVSGDGARVALSPPWFQGDINNYEFEFFVRVSSTCASLSQAADEWEGELWAFLERTRRAP